MPPYPTKLQLAYLKNLFYWTHESKVLEEPFTFTWEYKSAEFSPTRKQQRISSWWSTINEDFAALVFGGYMTVTEKSGSRYYQLTETRILAGHW